MTKVGDRTRMFRTVGRCSDVLILILLLGAFLLGERSAGAASLEHLKNLTGAAQASAALTERERFGNEYPYEVTIRNQSPDPLEVASLVIILDRLMDPTGKNVLDQMEVLNHDGQTSEGKPFFKFPPDAHQLLPPYSQSPPLTIRLRNPDYLPFFTPVFQVWGDRRLTPSGSLQALIRLLIDKGVLTENEWRDALEGNTSDR